MEPLEREPSPASAEVAASGWADELARLGEELRPRLLALARRLGVPERDAEDMVQETLLLAFLKAPRITRPTAWLLATLRYRCWMYWRRQGHRAGSEVAPDAAPAVSCALATSPDEATWAVLADVRRELARLPPKWRGVLVDYAVLREELPDLARRYGYRPSSVRKAISRSREALAAGLAREVTAAPSSRPPRRR